MTATITVYKSGSTYKAKNNVTGVALPTTSTTDAATVINAALSAIPNDGTEYAGGRVFIHAGNYYCTTPIKLNRTTLNMDGMEIVGEGTSTFIFFKPPSAGADGLFINMKRPRLADLHLYGTPNVKNIIHVQSELSPNNGNEGNLQNLVIHGGSHQTVSASTITSGQKGIFVEGGTSPGRQTFFWKYQNLDFKALDIGFHLYGQMATSALMNNVHISRTNVGGRISGAQNIFNNFWIQGNANQGQYGLYFTGEAGGTGSRAMITNVRAELYKTGVECAAVVFDTTSTNNKWVNVTNDYAGQQTYWHHVLDR